MRAAVLLLLLAAGCPAGPARPASAPTADPAIAYWTCPMHASVHAEGPGQCPICGMTLVPIDKDELESGAVRIDPARRERYGIALAPATRRTMERSFEVPAIVDWDRGKMSDVTLKVTGWISDVAVTEPVSPVRSGQVLFKLYAPDVVAAEDDLIHAAKATDAGAPERAAAARLRLKRWDLSDADIDAVLAAGVSSDKLAIRAPRTGWILDQAAISGAMASPGQTLYRIGDLREVLLEASLPAGNADALTVGEKVSVRVAGSDTPIDGTVTVIEPTVDPITRTVRARIAVDNASGALRPDQWATVAIHQPLGERLAVPDSAVVYTGPRRIVFVDEGKDRLVPHDVVIGASAGGYTEIVSGIDEGASVVVAGNFLVAADSRLGGGGTPTVKGGADDKPAMPGMVMP